MAVLELLKTFELPPLFTVGAKKNRYEEDGDLLIPVDYNAHRKTITVQLSFEFGGQWANWVSEKEKPANETHIAMLSLAD